MDDPDKLHDPWLVAAWPGMGNVAVGAGSYLVAKLGAKLVHEIPPQNFFNIQHVEVKKGVAKAGRFPRSSFFTWKNPKGTHDLLIFLGEAQPASDGYAFCHRLLDYAQQHNVKRIFTFAAMATQLHPSNNPRVFGVATNETVLQNLSTLEVEILKEGQISGLNGVLLAAGAERKIPGICLMGEIPFFAAGVPNLKASGAILEIFNALADVTLDFTELHKQAEQFDDVILQLLEKMKESARQQSDEEGFSVPDFATDEDDDEPDEPKEPVLDDAVRKRIELLFEGAMKDRNRAFQLKEELDRLGVFAQFEDRFLDLFKKAD